MTKFQFLLKGFGLFAYYGYWCPRRCWYIYILLVNATMVFLFLIFIRIEFHSFAHDTETAFCPTAVLRLHIYIWTSDPFLVILSDTLFRRLKWVFFSFELTLLKHNNFIHDGDSFSRKMILQLIYFKYFNSRVTWFRLKYFPVLVTFQQS